MNNKIKRACKVAGAVLVDIGTGATMAFGCGLIYVGAKTRNAGMILCGSGMIAASGYAYFEREQDILETGNYGLEIR